MRRILYYFVLVFLLSITAHSPVFAACTSSPGGDLPGWGPSVTLSSCNKTIAGVNGVDYATSEESTTNTSNLTLSGTTSLTINSGGTLVVGSLTLEPGTNISLAQSGGQIVTRTPIYITDTDADGWSSVEISSASLSTATGSGKRRLSFMRGYTADCGDGSYSTGNSCGPPTRDIAITNPGTTLTNYDVVFTLDTAALISAGKMTADCGDLRMYDSDGTTALSYWIEGGCNTTTTQIWTRVPSIPNGEKTIYATYDGITATNGFTAWSGSFLMLNAAACPSGWTRASTFDTRFPYGNAAYGASGGSTSHSHTNAIVTSGFGPNTTFYSGFNSPNLITAHTHGVTNTFSPLTTLYPPFLQMLFCNSSNLVINTNQIGLFDTTVPTGWTRFTALDNRYPLSSATYGGTGGQSTHTHPISNTVGGHSSPVYEDALIGQGEECAYSGSGHVHNSNSSNTAAANNEPPYLAMVYGSKNATGTAPSGVILMVGVLPPLGWTRFTALDAKFPRGASSYGATGGATSHSHSFSYNSSSVDPNGYRGSRCGTTNGRSPAGHTHVISGNTNSPANANIPPYVTMIFAKRNTPTATTSVGPEH